ncbi:uncharacterized protein F5Z01DRAFT_5315 [Emericellopsis atlantica]|uniref:Uncharacterized protein n=1 Tax=Emericellopsis atlantica TaxID=2614577 RepID=A0A9P7ZW12_9HYPO|nr:uncharacterized protein F5Z01DRAFT_5315 [Emericellopsis atlantica]KAG9258846.1 hypothetical protein F5Z01DRAFT_5315 [Emericellopsis atlantica]
MGHSVSRSLLRRGLLHTYWGLFLASTLGQIADTFPDAGSDGTGRLLLRPDSCATSSPRCCRCRASYKDPRKSAMHGRRIMEFMNWLKVSWSDMTLFMECYSEDMAFERDSTWTGCWDRGYSQSCAIGTPLSGPPPSHRPLAQPVQSFVQSEWRVCVAPTLQSPDFQSSATAHVSLSPRTCCPQ